MQYRQNLLLIQLLILGQALVYAKILEKNIQGDVTAIIDEQGKIVAEYSYDAWGVCTIISSVGGVAELNPIRYRGYYYDQDVGLYYLKTRWYDPEVGRFVNMDDISILDISRHQINGLNLYAYCGNDPINYCDSDGRLRRLFRSIGNAFSSAGRWVAGAATTVGNTVAGWATSAWNWTSNAAVNAWNWTANAATKAWNGFTWVMHDGLDWLGRQIGFGVEWGSNFINETWQRIRTLPHGLWQTLFGAWDWAMNTRAGQLTVSITALFLPGVSKILSLFGIVRLIFNF